jgi:hypothetical protein
MARFFLSQAQVISHKQLRAGTIICDGTSCSAGDVIFTGLNANTYNLGMNPLDAGAIAIKNASRYASANVQAGISGRDSIDA